MMHLIYTYHIHKSRNRHNTEIQISLFAAVSTFFKDACRLILELIPHSLYSELFAHKTGGDSWLVDLDRDKNRNSMLPWSLIVSRDR